MLNEEMENKFETLVLTALCMGMGIEQHPGQDCLEERIALGRAAQHGLKSSH